MTRFRTIRFLLAATAVLALAGCVAIDTVPQKPASPIYFDLNGNRVDDAEEYAGDLATYDASKEITFSWDAMDEEGIPLENLAYRIAMYQFPVERLTPDLLAEGSLPEIGAREMKVSYHWATSGTTFTIGALGAGEPVCYGCPTWVTVTTVRVDPVVDPVTGVTRYEYSPLDFSTTLSSEAFILQEPGR